MYTYCQWQTESTQNKIELLYKQREYKNVTKRKNIFFVKKNFFKNLKKHIMRTGIQDMRPRAEVNKLVRESKSHCLISQKDIVFCL